MISDVHGNLPALEAALEALKQRGCDMLVALGDDIGFGPSPAECCALLDDLGALRIRGNHERRMVDYLDGRVPEAESGLQWSAMRWMAPRVPASALDLPDTRVLDTRAGDVLLIHNANAAAAHAGAGVRLVLSGHTHGTRLYHEGGVMHVSPGSVGFSQQGLPYMCTFAVVRVAERHFGVEFDAAGYDAARATALFKDSGLLAASPQFSHVLIDCMRTGRDTILPFIEKCRAIMRRRGLSAPAIPDDVWLEAARGAGIRA